MLAALCCLVNGVEVFFWDVDATDETEPSDVLEKVRLRSMIRRMWVSSSSKYLMADVSVIAMRSGLSSYSLGHCNNMIISWS